MKLGFVSAILGELSFEEMIDFASKDNSPNIALTNPNFIIFTP